MNNFFLVHSITHHVRCHRNCQPRFPGALFPDPQLHRRGFLFRRRDVLDGLRSLVHHPGREGPPQRWPPVRDDRFPHHPPLRGGLPRGQHRQPSRL